MEGRYLRKLLATNMRRARSKLGISQEELASRAGLHRTYVGGVERCERNVGIDNIERIARALSSSASELLSERKEV